MTYTLNILLLFTYYTCDMYNKPPAANIITILGKIIYYICRNTNHIMLLTVISRALLKGYITWTRKNYR